MSNLYLNEVLLCGKICNMGETRETKSGKVMKNFSIAINKRAPKKGGKSSTIFINCVVWESQAKILDDYFATGDHICVKGSLENGAYVRGDVRLTILQVSVKTIYFVDKKGVKNEQGQVVEQAVPELPPEADPWATNPWQEEVFF